MTATAYKWRMDPTYEAAFVFCGPDFARDMNLRAGLPYFSDVTNSIETATFPVENVSDGNRNTFCEITNLGRKTGNYASIRIPLYDSSNRTLFSSIDGSFNCLCIENDPMYPINSFRIYYETPSFGSGINYLDITEATFSIGGLYFEGSYPRIDGEYLANPESAAIEYSGNYGRYIFIPFDESILGNAGNITLLVTSLGRNDFGVDGSFDNGLWSGSVDETIETSDPDPNSTGANGNYMQLATLAAGGDKTSRGSFIGVRPSHEYMLGFHHKQAGLGSNGYSIYMSYSNKDHADIDGPHLLWQVSGIDTSWGEVWIPMFYKEGGKTYCGGGSAKHEVPDGAFGITFNWHLIAHATDAQTWKIDDVTFYSCDIKHNPKDYKLHSVAGKYLPHVNDQSGTFRIRRISLFSHEFLTSQHKYSPALKSDWQGHAPFNPMSWDSSLRGKTVIDDFYGNPAGQFIPKTGLKRVQNLTFLLDQMAASYMQDLANRENPIGVVFPDGDFGEFVILDGVKFAAIGRSSRQKASIYDGPEKILFQTILPISEV